MQVFKLQFHSALHVDSKGSGAPEAADEFVRSDSLSAALALSWAALYADTDADFFLDPPFTVSSAFPFVHDLLLLPTPAWPIWPNLSDAQRKSFKKVRWLSRKLFMAVVNQNPIDAAQVHLAPGGIALFADELEAHPMLRAGQPWMLDERQRVHVDRLGLQPEGGLFFFALQFFAPWSGLWFLSRGPADVLQRLRSVLDYLGDTGLGADRNSGLGHFKVAEVSEPAAEGLLPAPETTTGHVTLSLFNPGAHDDLQQLLRASAYSITRRSGWISQSTIGRPPIRVFTEGSFFAQKPVGRVTPMLPEALRQQTHLPLNHSAPRDFRAISLPCVTPAILKEEPS